MTDQEKIETLSQVIQDIFWMARRYADGGQTYVIEIYNQAIIRAMEAGVEIEEHGTASKWAYDGDPRIAEGQRRIYAENNT